jgi:antitoxin (DNA-binding transcriptional repressor) of toxin-antitoxin stability system
MPEVSRLVDLAEQGEEIVINDPDGPSPGS